MLSKIVNQNEPNNKKSNRPLLIILLLILFIIIILIINIIVVKINHNDNNSEEDPLYFPEVNCDNPEDAYAIQTCLQEYYNKTNDIEKYIKGFQSYIDKAIQNKNYNLAANLINARSISLIDINNCGNAIQQLDQLDPSLYDSYSLAIIYSGAISTSKSCNDPAAETKWTKAYIELTNGIQNETQ